MGMVSLIQNSVAFSRAADYKAKIDSGLASQEEIDAYNQYAAGIKAAGSNVEKLAISSSEPYQQALLKYQAQAQQNAAQTQAKDVLNLRAAEERASRVVTLDNRKVSISVGGTADAEEIRRRRMFSSTNILPTG